MSCVCGGQLILEGDDIVCEDCGYHRQADLDDYIDYGLELDDDDEDEENASKNSKILDTSVST